MANGPRLKGEGGGRPGVSVTTVGTPSVLRTTVRLPGPPHPRYHCSPTLDEDPEPVPPVPYIPSVRPSRGPGARWLRGVRGGGLRP